MSEMSCTSTLGPWLTFSLITASAILLVTFAEAPHWSVLLTPLPATKTPQVAQMPLPVQVVRPFHIAAPLAHPQPTLLGASASTQTPLLEDKGFKLVLTPLLIFTGSIAAVALLGRLLSGSEGKHHTPTIAMSAVTSTPDEGISRRAVVLAPGVATALMMASPAALARLPNPPQGFLRFRGALADCYDFVYPETWFKVNGAGDTVLFRSAYNPEITLFMNISSPTASRYTDLESLGSPEEVAVTLRDQLLLELMSTRLGVRREAQIVSATARTGGYDGKLYYDIDVRIQSYAGINQMAELPSQRPILLEWDRHFITTLAVANKRLYELRIVIPVADMEQQQSVVSTIQKSFRAYDAA